MTTGAAATAGCGVLEREPDAETERLADEEGRRMAERYAPVLYFDAAEKWFPTDPRPFEREADGETVVDGFATFDGYTEQYRERGEPPAPTLFYRALGYADSSLAVVQYWWYAAFDQFSANFHWHDWEVVHVFVDRETGEPELFVASAHSRSVPNNEFLDPDAATVPRVLSELGSHSSALSINDIPDRFQRLPTADTFADITNRAVDAVESVAEFPVAYGLPRDEGLRLPYLVPELDGRPIYEDDRLPAVDRAALIAPALTVRSFDALATPPTDLPERETGLVFGYGGESNPADVVPDVTYDLVPAAELEHIAAFSGPQLSFEFAVPGFAEDLVAGHVTTTGVPWEQERYDNPAADISEPAHRRELAERYDAVGRPGSLTRLIAAVKRTEQDDHAPAGEGVTTTEPAVETIALLESDPEAVPTFGGVAVIEDVPAGDHRLTVNGAGVAPHSEQVSVTDDPGPDLAGVEGEIALTASENAVKLRVDAGGTDADLTDLAVEDDFGGRLYDAPLDGPDAVYVDRRGAYTTEVRDSDDEVGAFRVNPAADPDGDEEAGPPSVTVDRPRTGKASLSTYLSSVAEETGSRVREGTDLDDDDGRTPTSPRSGGGGGSQERGVRGLVQALDAVAAAADRAAELAEEGDASGADERIEAVQRRLAQVGERLTESRADLADPVANAIDRRLEQSGRRARQARNAGKL